MKKVISAGVIIFRRTTEGIKYLLLYHGKGYWNFPKGRLEHAERSIDAAIRETNEETGLKENELQFHSSFKTFERFVMRGGKERVFKIVILYLAETQQPEITISEEHEGFGWFTFGEAKKALLKYKETQKILEQAHRYLTVKKSTHKTTIVPL